jgi:superfamily II DNA or RNA helicase
MKIYKDERFDTICFILESVADKKVALDHGFSILNRTLAKIPLTFRSVDKLKELIKKNIINAEIDELILKRAEILRLEYENEIVSRNYDEKIFERKKREAAEQRLKVLLEEKPFVEQANRIKKDLIDKKRFDGFKCLNNKLMPHQKAGCAIAEVFNKYAFFYDTGTGKTVLALEIMMQRHLYDNTKFLVICPKTIIQTAWMADCESFYPAMKLLPLSKNISLDKYLEIHRRWNINDKDLSFEERFISNDYCLKGSVADKIEKIQRKLIQRADHFIINPETFLRKREYFESLGISGLIIDESSILKNIDNEITRRVRDLSEKVKYTYLLSGKPAPNTVLEYFPQMKVVDSVQFYMSYDSFKTEFFDKNSGYKQTKSKQANRDVAELINRKSVIVSKEDCLSLPPKSYIVRKVTLDQETMTQYNTMCHQLHVQYKEDEKTNRSLSVFNALASAMKLRQIASGFLIDENKISHCLHDTKLKELKQVIQELGNNQAIIWCEFRHEVRAIENMLAELGKKVVTAYGGTKDKDDSIIKFKSGLADYIIANPKTLKFGVTLTNCTYAIYFSTSYSYEDYYQSHDRIYRKGQLMPCTYIFLQAEDTIDEIMYDVIQNKKSRAEFMELLIKDAAARPMQKNIDE